MKPRARRVTMGVAVLVAIILAVLVATHWGTVRDHVEAWHFQLTTETETVIAEPILRGPQLDQPECLHHFAIAKSHII